MLTRSHLLLALLITLTTNSYASDTAELTQTTEKGLWSDQTLWKNEKLPANGDSVFIRTGKQIILYSHPNTTLSELTVGENGSTSSLFILQGSIKLEKSPPLKGDLYIGKSAQEKTLGSVSINKGALLVDGDIHFRGTTIYDSASITISSGTLNAQNFISSQEGVQAFTIMGDQGKISFSGDFWIKSNLMNLNFAPSAKGCSTISVHATLTLNGNLSLNLTEYKSEEDIIIFEYSSPEELIGNFTNCKVLGGSGELDYYKQLENGKFGVALTSIKLD